MAAVETAPRFTPIATDGHERLIEAYKAILADAKAAKAQIEFNLAAVNTEIKWREEQIRGLRTGEAVPTGNGQSTATRSRTRARMTAKPISEQAVFDAMKTRSLYTSSALAKALGTSQETILRKLRALAERGMVTKQGIGRDLRWMPAPAP
jgi:predicted HTH transcriptional regulator